MRSVARTEPVVVHQVRVERRATEVLLSCRLRAPDGALPPELWFRFPADVGAFVEAIGDPFLPPLLLYCMKAGVPLVIEADVSAMLLAAVRPVQDIYCLWAAEKGPRLTRVDVTAGTTVRPRHGSASAAFFSCGVDSFYTLLRNVQRYPAGDSRFIRELVLVHGFDIALADGALFEQVEVHAQKAADHFGKRLTSVATNIRAVTEVVDWALYGHGAALAAVGLVLGGLAHTIFIPATSAFVDLKPWGSHPALDPLWSTEQVEFVNDGGEARRAEKVRSIASSDAALQSLRVCWENPQGAYNCGRCEKCLRTMIELRHCGAIQRAVQFPNRIEPADVERLTIPEDCLKHWRRMLDRREELASRELVVAIEQALRRSAGANVRKKRALAAIARRLPLIGLTPSRINALDRRWLGGNLGRLQRRIAGR